MRTVLPALVVAIFVLSSTPADEAEDQLTQDMRVLEKAGVPSDGPNLLEFFRKRTLSDAQLQQIGTLIAELDHEVYAVREAATRQLIALGTPARTALEQAARTPDPEISTRARRALDAIPASGSLDQTLAVLRVLRQRRPDGAISVLLAFLPSAADETLEEEIVAVLSALNQPGGRIDSALALAVRDPSPLRRLAAGSALARLGLEGRAAARPLLQDPEPRIRLHTARALLLSEDPAGVATLIALVGESPTAIALQAEDLLFRLGGTMAPELVPVDPVDPASRERNRAAWQGWWQGHVEKIDLGVLTRAEPYLGLNIICDCDVGEASNGRVWECGPDGKPRWQINGVRNPADVQLLPNGRLLIAECQGYRVTERDRQGNVLWERRVEGYPVSCQRLANGNVFIATYTELLEVTREGRTVYSHVRPNSVYCAQKLGNGNILYVHSSGQMVEMDVAGKEIKTVPVGNTSGWAGVEVLPNGRFLIAQYSANRVVEFDASGQERWSCTVQTPAWATRLPNGHTLVASPDGRCLYEMDRNGQKVNQLPTHGRPFRVRRR